MKRPTLPDVRDVHRVSVEPGDVVVVEIPSAVTAEQRRLVEQQLHALWPNNPALVLTNGMRLQIGTPGIVNNGKRKRGRIG